MVLVEENFRHVSDENLRNAYKELIWIILGHQYVTCEELGATCAAIVGNGQGAVHSGNVSAVCVYQLLERGILNGDDVKVHVRFRDDLFTVFRGGTRTRLQAQEFIKAKVWAWQRRLVHWVLDVESISAVEVPMLDLCIGRGPAGRFSDRPYFKDTALLVPLTVTSIHPSFVHSWPLSEAARLARQSDLV